MIFFIVLPFSLGFKFPEQDDTGLDMYTGQLGELENRTATVSRVIDGATIELATGETIRLAGLAVPIPVDFQNRETADRLGIKPGFYESYAETAKKFLEDRFKDSKEVQLRFDDGNQKISQTNKKKLFAYAYIEIKPSGEFRSIETPFNEYMVSDQTRHENGNVLVFLNATLIRGGYGTVDSGSLAQYKEDFLAWEKEARIKGRGMWAKDKRTKICKDPYELKDKQCETVSSDFECMGRIERSNAEDRICGHVVVKPVKVDQYEEFASQNKMIHVQGKIWNAYLPCESYAGDYGPGPASVCERDRQYIEIESAKNI